MQEEQGIFDELVSQLSRGLSPVTHAVESLPSGVDIVLLTVSAFWAGLFVYVLILNKEVLGLKKWLEKNCELPSLKVSVFLLFAFSLLSFFHEPALCYFLNNPLIVATLFGFPILIKRLSVMQEQTEKSQRQVEIGQQQTRINQYNAANDWLWSNHLGLRMAGIDSLWRLAGTYPKEEYHNVMDVFCQFIRHPIPYEWKEETSEQDKKEGDRADIYKMLQYMCKERMAGAKPYKIDFSEAHLEGATFLLFPARLELATLIGTHLEGSYLGRAHLEGSILRGANLEGANLWEADLRLAVINKANFTNAQGLTQQQIDECVFIQAPFFDKTPILPDGMTPTYRKMTMDEWKEAMSKSFPHEHLYFRF